MICRACKQDLLLEEMVRDTRRKNGHDSICLVCHRKRQSIWRKKNRDSHREYARRWSKENKDHRNTSHRVYLKRLRKEALEFYGRKCVCCGEDHPEFLAFDHIHGNGKVHRGNTGAANFLRRLLKKKDPEIRILCHNCNMSLGFYGYCPHEAN